MLLVENVKEVSRMEMKPTLLRAAKQQGKWEDEQFGIEPAPGEL